MKINIITPCSRPENLEKISRSINIPSENYEWLVIFDSTTTSSSVPDNCSTYCIKLEESRSGNVQRNLGIKLVNYGYLYFLDDDTVMHPELWENIKNVENDMIVFPQIWKDGRIRLTGDVVRLNHTDSGNFIVKRSVVGDLLWDLKRYDADGIFAEQCAKAAKSILYLNKPLSIYNALR